MRGLVSVTATDTAVLCGKHPEVCLRKYYGLPLNNSYSNEIALRLLISLVALTSSRLGISIYPLFAHTNMHYIRFYAKVVISNKQANKGFYKHRIFTTLLSLREQGCLGSSDGERHVSCAMQNLARRVGYG